MVQRFGKALEEEREHLHQVRGWHEAATLAEAGVGKSP